MVKRIKLGDKEIIVDEHNYERIKACKWRLAGKNKDIITTGSSYTGITIGRFIMGYYGPDTIDHIDRDIWNNLENNLRIATSSQQEANKGPQNGKQYKGVSYFKRDKKYRARLEVIGKAYFGGYHSTEIEAAKAYDKLAKKHFGEFAYLNFPSEEPKPCLP